MNTTHDPHRSVGLRHRIHQRLMPDYNRPAAIYWWLMVMVGGALVVHAVLVLARLPGTDHLRLVAGLALAMFAGLFSVKIPRTTQVFAAGDAFIFLLLLTHGPEAGILAAALEAMVSAWRSSTRWTTRLGSVTIAAVTMALCGHALHAAMAWLPGDWGSLIAQRTSTLVLMAAAFGMIYAACSAFLMSVVGRLKRGQSWLGADFVSLFGWVAGASAAAAAMAALLHAFERSFGPWMLLAVLPTVGLVLTTLHFFARQQESEGAARLAEARQREAEIAAQHLHQLERSEQRFNSAFTHASIGMALVAESGELQLANPALGRLLGVAPEQLIGTRFQHLMLRDEQTCTLDLHVLADTAADAGAKTCEVLCRRIDSGEAVWASISCAAFSEPGAPEASFILQVQDVSARRRAEAELSHRAYHDKLTGLPNRDSFLEALASMIDASRKGQSMSLFAVLFLDFDRFKLVNDSKGHGAGDEFLVQASSRLARCLRHGDLLARLGGDEFAILARDLGEDAAAMDLADRLQQSLTEPLELGAMTVNTSASIGITFSSMGYTNPEDMLRDADIAMYRAKQDGKARHALFDVKLHRELSDRVRLEGELREALAQGQLEIAFQPLLDIVSGRLTGFEALSRWNHPEHGPISPGVFVPIAEDSALIIGLTDFMMQGACRQLRAWQERYPSCRDMHVHVNAAARDLADPRFVQRVRNALDSAGLAPGCLVIELTEGILMSQLTAAMGSLEALRMLGVGLSVDDFGTGYSSLSHLARLPIDSLKIDMSFIRPLSPGSKEAAVVRAIVLLGTSLGKTVIAEGIETKAQLELLRDMGCQQGQGYHFAKPLLADAAQAFIERSANEQLSALLEQDGSSARATERPAERPTAASRRQHGAIHGRRQALSSSAAI